MSDQRPDHEPPDPIDAAYARAEEVLADEADRAARRQRVLAAVAQASDEATPEPPVRRRSPPWGRGGWLVAACVAALGLFLGVAVYRPPVLAPPTQATAPADAPIPPPRAAAGPATVQRPAAAPTRGAAAPIEAGSQRHAPPVGPGREPSIERAPVTVVPAPPPSPPPPSAPPPPWPASPEAIAAPQRAAPSAQSEAVGSAAPAESARDEIVVTGARASRPAAKAAAPAAPPDAAFAAPSASARGSQPAGGHASDTAARLRAAAAAGRTAELASLLDAGAPIDAPDADGDTALMKSVRADRPAAAALLRRHGASLERRNHAGESARDIAAKQSDPALDRALGIAP